MSIIVLLELTSATLDSYFCSFGCQFSRKVWTTGWKYKMLQGKGRKIWLSFQHPALQTSHTQPLNTLVQPIKSSMFPRKQSVLCWKIITQKCSQCSLTHLTGFMNHPWHFHHFRAWVQFWWNSTWRCLAHIWSNAYIYSSKFTPRL